MDDQNYEVEDSRLYNDNHIPLHERPEPFFRAGTGPGDEEHYPPGTET